jgi:hypothetical protein
VIAFASGNPIATRIGGESSRPVPTPIRAITPASHGQLVGPATASDANPASHFRMRCEEGR